MSEQKRRGAPPANERLSRDQIVSRAFTLIEADGLQKFSIRRLARELGIQPAALYNHVKDRDELLDEVTNTFIEGFEQIEPNRPWPQALLRIAASSREHLNANPHMTDLLLSRRAAVPATRHYIENLTNTLQQAGFDPPTAHATMHALLTAVFGTALQEQAWNVDRTTEYQFLIRLIIDGLQSRQESA